MPVCQGSENKGMNGSRENHSLPRSMILSGMDIPGPLDAIKSSLEPVELGSLQHKGALTRATAGAGEL